MKVIKTRLFTKWASKNDVSDASLFLAAQEIANGKFEANYGGGVLKKRIATKGRGKSSSVRTIIAFKKGMYCFFIYGFEKNVKSNVSTNEEKALKIVAKSLFKYSESEILDLLKNGALLEIQNE